MACSALTSVAIPGSAQDMGHHIFYLCTALKSVEIREGIKKLECAIFRDCQSLENISYSGTMEQWQQIELDYYWNWNVPAKQVRCSNGNVNIEKSPK